MHWPDIQALVHLVALYVNNSGSTRDYPAGRQLVATLNPARLMDVQGGQTVCQKEVFSVRKMLRQAQNKLNILREVLCFVGVPERI